MKKSTNWKHWIAQMDDNLCPDCLSRHGKIYHINEKPVPKPPLHLYCRCIIIKMNSIKAGTATYDNINGADWYIKQHRKLPNNYITKDEAQKSGWKTNGNTLSDVCPNKMIGGDIFYNAEGKLPTTYGRIWYEADINYTQGQRNIERIVYSNDGLIFVTYDHYETFCEIE